MSQVFEIFFDKKKNLEYNPRVKRIGPVVERVLYSIKLKAVPNLYLKQVPLSKLLPVTRHHPILTYSLAQIMIKCNGEWGIITQLHLPI